LFKFLNKLVDKKLQVYTGESGGADSFLYFGRKNSDHLSIILSFDEEINGYDLKLVPSAEDRFIFAEESVWYHYKPLYASPYRKYLSSGHSESKLSEYSDNQSKNVAHHVIQDLKSWKLYHFHDTSESAKVKLTGDISENRMLNPDASNLAALLYSLQKTHPQHFNNIEDTVRLVAPFFHSFHLEPTQQNPQKIMLEWYDKGSDQSFNASALSDGTLRFMCLTTLLLQPKLPSIILLDEPELGLHPYAITMLAELLKSASKSIQVIIATQSVTLVNQFEPSQIFVVERKDNQSTFTHLQDANMEEWLDEFGVGDLWEKNIFGGRP